MGIRYQPGRPTSGAPEDIRRQTQRTIAIYEDVLERAREVAHDAEERLHRVLGDGKRGAQRSTGDHRPR